MCVILREKEIKPYEDTQLVRLHHDGINLISGQPSVEVNEDSESLGEEMLKSTSGSMESGVGR